MVGTVSAGTSRVVIADDDPDIRALISIAVRRAGLELLAEAEDGDRAHIALQEHHPDLAILDVSMPGMTGLELCRLIRADDAFAGMHIVLLSAAVDDQARAAGIEAGADEFFAKPFSPREFGAWLSQLAIRED
jgi:DNA-binding response OmpR family regulator